MMAPPAHRLGTLAAAWRRRWLAGAVLAAFGAGALGAAALARFTHRPLFAVMLLGLLFAAALLGLLVRLRPRVDARTIARHLDRTLPALEDSAELLLADWDRLAPLPRLQRGRAQAAFDRAAPSLRLPHRPFTRLLRIAAALLLAAAALALWPAPRAPGAAPASGARTVVARPAPPALTGTTVRITPPAYTGRPPRTVDGWELADVAEGATVRWDIRTSGTVAAIVMVTTDGDTAAGPTPALVARNSALYAVTASGPGGTSTSDYHRLLVIPDQPPTVAVVRPDLRTLLPAGAPLGLDLEVLASDDYGLGTMEIAATVTSGRGEGVKFREQRLAFPRRERRPGGGLLLRATLDLAALGMGPGDELYFHIVARDTRSPDANETRSETHFVALADTAAVRVADFTGLGVNLLPEYFRSQRQIVIDTERLLADRPAIGAQPFRDRSQNIGLDQHALRVRYGEIVGDEIEEAVEAFDPAQRHEHDTEENATRLASGVKQTLKRALNEMWQAELLLRSYDPQAALPYEYRALEYLKEVQQAVRVYVQRVGFEPPPIEADRIRLTGDVAAVTSRTSAFTRPSDLPLPAIRSALQALISRALEPGSGTIPALEAAGRELAPLAIDDPVRHLPTLRELRALITALHSGASCPGCAARVERGLLGALPPPGRAAVPSRGAGRGAARTYFELLGGPP